MKSVLVTDYVHPILLEGLDSLGYHVDYDKTISLAQVADCIDQYEGIVINSKVKMDKTMIDRAKSLKWIARLGSGLDIIDLPYAAQHKIAVYNSPEGNRNAVAEHTIGMLLAIHHQLLPSDIDVRRKNWDRESRRGTEMMGKTIGLIGLGNTGSAVAAKLASWGMHVLAYDLYQPIAPASLPHVESVSLSDLQARSDIISMHVPLTPLTHGMINLDFLTKCKDGVIIANTSRGKVVVVEDLITSILRGKVAGACLDVFPNEKTGTYTEAEHTIYDNLFAMPQVVLSPHVAGWTHESLRRIADVLLLKIKRGDNKVSP